MSALRALLLAALAAGCASAPHQDRDRGKYRTIGESDRFTLKFEKR